ncbi:hypothetical protein JVX98_31250 (plasmid) [Ensifer sp. PDNC004]|uniref:hypothetical protein n=1 Tax=unclassified Ensifer TaxID=2633371 RepID=UPI00177B8972|nr:MULTISPECIES: hypothetical protein [unclassified Ensifer]MBD9649918.1 hypothetical protein [Ensifer sp. ENS09]QRY70527.1 hypothetical protein JVX98_31250 [Ensifer sp. PDNC004]
MDTAKCAYAAITAVLLSTSPTLSLAQQPPAENRDEQPAYEMMPGAMMGGGWNRFRGYMRPGMMHGPMMKIMFAVADVNGDGALSFDEITAIHKRIFDAVDVNKDGKVTSEEIQGFMRDQ